MKDGLKEKLLNTAQKIAENLYQKRIVNDDGINWVYKTKGLHSNTPQFKPLNESVYDGETGIAYFFFQASKIFNNHEYFELAQKILIECAKEFTYEFQNNFDYESNQRFK